MHLERALADLQAEVADLRALMQAPPRPTKATRFVPPTEDEVLAYARELQQKGDRRYADAPVMVEEFMLFYEANGWMAGRSRMKSWQSAFRRACLNWERKAAKDSRGGARRKWGQYRVFGEDGKPLP